VRSVEFHPEAQREFVSAARFYERQTVGLGIDFGPPFGPRLRRVLAPKFPYGLLYRVEPERIYVIAVMHLHRRPGYWRSRL
jgi:hypothetical protein